jgi:hypothetical protein
MAETTKNMTTNTFDFQVRHVGRLYQARIYFVKFLRMFIFEGDWKVLPMAALIAGLVSIVVAADFFLTSEGTLIGTLAFACICIWNGCFNSIQVVCRERDVLKREHRSGMHISAYVLAHMLYQCLLCVLQVIVTLIVTKLLGVSFPEKGLLTPWMIVDFGITMFLITYAADMLGLMISCIVHTPMTAMTVMPFVLIVQLVFANFVIPLNDFGQKVSNITISKWGIQAICAVSDYNSQESTVLLTALNTMNNRDPESLVSRIQRVLSIDEVNHKVGQLTAAQLQKANYAFTTENVLKNWGILLGFTLLYVVIGLIFLEQVDHDKR